MNDETRILRDDALIALRRLRVNGENIPNDVWKAITNTILDLDVWKAVNA